MKRYLKNILFHCFTSFFTNCLIYIIFSYKLFYKQWIACCILIERFTIFNAIRFPYVIRLYSQNRYLYLFLFLQAFLQVTFFYKQIACCILLEGLFALCCQICFTSKACCILLEDFHAIRFYSQNRYRYVIQLHSCNSIPFMEWISVKNGCC